MHVFNDGSGPGHPRKRTYFQSIGASYAAVCARVAEKQGRRLMFVDHHGGAPYTANSTSSLLYGAMMARGVTTTRHLWISERNQLHAKGLAEQYAASDYVTVHPTDCTIGMRRLWAVCRDDPLWWDAVGFAISDPAGVVIPAKAMHAFMSKMPKFDLMAHLTISTFSRLDAHRGEFREAELTRDLLNRGPDYCSGRTCYVSHPWQGTRSNVHIVALWTGFRSKALISMLDTGEVAVATSAEGQRRLWDRRAIIPEGDLARQQELDLE